MGTVRHVVVGGIRALRPAARRVALAAGDLGVPTVRRPDVELAVHECLANALEHGHRGDPMLGIDIEVAGGGPATVTVRISDRALAGRWTPSRRNDAGSHHRPGERGHGLRLVTASTDGLELHVSGGRTTVVLCWFTAVHRLAAVGGHPDTVRHR